MKKFVDSGIYFNLTTLLIREIPYETENNESYSVIARTICDDACNLSAEGTGQTAIELLRVSENTTGKPISHLITIRTHDKNDRGCTVRHTAIVNGINTMLFRNGYVCEEINYDAYHRFLGAKSRRCVWALKKTVLQDYGVQGTYDSIPIVDSVDWRKIYSVLDGSGCSLCIQIIPTMLSSAEREMVVKNAAKCSQAIDGVIPNMHDKLATSSSERWRYLSEHSLSPFAEVNIIVSGEETNAALAIARIKQAVNVPSMVTVPVQQFYNLSIYNLPWQVANDLKGGRSTLINKWTSDEVSGIFQLPVQSDYFVGVKGNPFSLTAENELIPDELTGGKTHSVQLGRSAFSSQSVSLPQEQLLLHTAVMGKSGSGKTTLMKSMISQLHADHVPVLVFEPVKREYRDLIAPMENSRIFTVEKPLVPLLINPFYVPEGVTLGDYKSSLFSAFKAAFALPDPLPSLFEKAISESYIQNGWTDMSKSTDGDVKVFDMTDFMRVFKRIISRSTYSNEVKGNMMSGGVFRLQSLIERCPRTFDTVHSTSVEELLKGSVVIEMGSLEGEQKALVSALTLISILAYLKATRISGNKLRNIILIDETHALLDQGVGVIQEEKSLNNTMSVLLINTITEMRAYGVGVIFSDQSPSRVGGQLIDNVDNIISFRTSGEEAARLAVHTGSDEKVTRLLSQLSPGEFILKNRYVNNVIPVRYQFESRGLPVGHISDEKVFRSQVDYLRSHAKDYCPYMLCECAGCNSCKLGIRELSKKSAMQLFASRQSHLKTPEEIAQHIILLHKILAEHEKDMKEQDFNLMCSCVAVHLLRLCALENDVSISGNTIRKLIKDMNKNGRRIEHE